MFHLFFAVLSVSGSDP